MWVWDKAVITFVRSLSNNLMMVAFFVATSLVISNENDVAIGVGGSLWIICLMMSRNFGGSSNSQTIGKNL